MTRAIALTAIVCSLTLGLTACEREGTGERIGEEVDEAADTIRSGEESTSDRLDDAADEVRGAAEDATE